MEVTLERIIKVGMEVVDTDLDMEAATDIIMVDMVTTVILVQTL